MTTHHKDACRCGSGKRYKHCHLAADQAKARRGWMTAFGALGALVVGIAAWGGIAHWREGRAQAGGGRDSLRLPAGGPVAGGGGDVSGSNPPAPSGAFGSLVPGQDAHAPIGAGAGSSLPSRAASSNELQPGEHPTPWQYDVARNRHFDPRPGHQHWHNGPPPSDTTGAISAPTVTVGGANTKVTTSIVPAPGSMNLKPGENPAPWEYDKAKDRHFNPNPGHRHWHAGPPPPVSQRAP